jgi:hypothetical protein
MLLMAAVASDSSLQLNLTCEMPFFSFFVDRTGAEMKKKKTDEQKTKYIILSQKKTALFT